MSLIALTAEFIKKLNQLIPNLDVRNPYTVSQLGLIKQKMKHIESLTFQSENKIIDYLKRKERSKFKVTDFIIIRKNEVLKAIVSTSIQKPIIEEVEKIESDCACLISNFLKSSFVSKLMLIENEKQLFEVDECLKEVFVCVYDHSYRSFEGFTCYITLATPDGCFYAIDAIKFRDIIPKLKFLKCGVKKLIHCRNCVKRLIKDFGSIGCYRNFDIIISDVYIDWRIRPLDKVFIVTMIEQMQEVISKSNLRIPTEKYELEATNDFSEFLEKNKIPIECPLLAEMINLRQYLSKQYDEGIQYVLTDKQIIDLIEALPRTVQEFESVIPRMSSVLRPHVGDFLLILMKRVKTFSMEKLKGEKTFNDPVEIKAELFPEEPKFRQFNKK